MISKHRAEDIIKTLTKLAFTTWPEFACVLHMIVRATQIMVIGPNVKFVNIDFLVSAIEHILVCNDKGVAASPFLCKELMSLLSELDKILGQMRPIQKFVLETIVVSVLLNFRPFEKLLELFLCSFAIEYTIYNGWNTRTWMGRSPNLTGVIGGRQTR